MVLGESYPRTDQVRCRFCVGIGLPDCVCEGTGQLFVDFYETYVWEEC